MIIDKRQIRRILIIQFGRLGDVLVSTPLVRALKKALPGAEISYLVSSYAEPLLRNNPYISELSVLEITPFHILSKKDRFIVMSARLLYVFLRKLEKLSFPVTKIRLWLSEYKLLPDSKKFQLFRTILNEGKKFDLVINLQAGDPFAFKIAYLVASVSPSPPAILM